MTILQRSTCPEGGTTSPRGFTAPFLFIASLFLLFSGGGLTAQPIAEPCVGGRLYYIAFPDTVTNTRDPRFPDRTPESITLMIYSSVKQSVALSRGSWSRTVSVGAGDMVEVELAGLGENTPLVTTINRPDDHVVRVAAESPVIVYAVMSTRFGMAGFTPLPVDAWGVEYYAASWPGMPVRNIYPAGEMNYDAQEVKSAPAEIMIVAAYDNTRVSINPTGGLTECVQCTQVTLDAGEAYIVQSMVDLREEAEAQEDIAGSLIQANRPIGVVSGNTRTDIRPRSRPFQMLAGNSVLDMAVEWLRPVELHGKEFAFLPVQDLVRQRENAEIVREAEYLRLYPTQRERTTFRGTNSSGEFVDLGNGGVDPTEFLEWRIGDLQSGRAIRSDYRAQVFQGISSVAAFNGTTGFGNFIGASYNSWGSAMVEITPRERWVSRAPWRAPTIPADQQHFMNLVTDAGSVQKIFLRQGDAPRRVVTGWKAIAGTGMVWTSFSIDAGTTYVVEGDVDARFGGFAYGERRGYELFRPGSAFDDGKENATSSAHPAEYEESIAGTYALPLVSSTCSTGEPRHYIVETLDIDCDHVTLRIRTDDSAALDMKYLRLVSGSTENVRLELIEPDNFLMLGDADEVIIRLSRINPGRSGHVLLEYRDRTANGTIQRLEFNFGTTAYFSTDPLLLDFRDVTGPSERTMLLTNRSNADISLRSLDLAFRSSGFTIVGTSPRVPWNDPNRLTTFGPGDSLLVTISFTPSGGAFSLDSLIVDLECGRMALPIVATTAEACIFVGDLDFGNLRMGETKTLPLEICNNGTGNVTFEGGGVPVTWLLPEFFAIPHSDIDRLRNTLLGAGECVTINVTFSSHELIGYFRSVARFWASTRKCRDTSVWEANVGISSVAGGEDVSGYRLGSIAPNPTDGELGLNYDLPQGGTTVITLVDPTGREVRSLFENHEEAGSHSHTFGLDGLPSGLYFLRIRSGAWDVVEGIYVVR